MLITLFLLRLDKMLDIVETTHRHEVIDLQTSRGKETVLHLAAEEGLTLCVKRLIELGADLSIQDENGDTVLHRLAKATVENPRHLKRHLEVFDLILEMIVKWWTKKKQIVHSTDNYKKLKKEATLYLIYDILNKEGLSVITLSFKIGAVDVLSRLLMMQGVTQFVESDSKYKFDVSQLTPQTNKSYKNGCSRVALMGTSGKSGLEWLTTQSGLPHATRIQLLELPPMKTVVNYYESMIFWIYLLLMVIHIIYMGTFTYVGFDLSAALRDGKRTDNVLLYILPVEPFCMIIYTMSQFDCELCMYILSQLALKISCRKTGTVNIWPLATYIYMILYTMIVIVWIILVSVRWNYHDYFLAASLCLGWLFSISLTRGFKNVHYFFRMLISMILRDFIRFSVFYIFVLFAFGFAFHAMFIISPEIIRVFHTPMNTLFYSFEWMTGRGELFTEEFEKTMDYAGRELTFFKIFYLIYIIFSSIILVNLVIAMMNDSYRKIEKKQHLTWKLDSVAMGFGMETTFPKLRKLFSRIEKENNEGIAIN